MSGKTPIRRRPGAHMFGSAREDASPPAPEGGFGMGTGLETLATDATAFVGAGGRSIAGRVASGIALARAGRELAGDLDDPATLQRVVDLVTPAVADWCIVYMLEPDGELRRAAIAHADPAKAGVAEALRRLGPSAASRNGAVLRALQSDRTVLTPEIGEDYFASVARDARHLALLRQLEARSAMAVPLRARGRTLGVLALYRSDPNRHYGQRDLALAEALARMAALALENAELYAAEQRARERAERLAAERDAVLRQVTDGVVAVDPAGGVSFANRAARDLLGDGAGLTGLAAHPLARAALRGETVVEAELALAGRDGAETPLRGSAMPVALEGGRRLGAVLTLRDVTAERAQQRERDEFFASVSHDLRTPAAVIHSSLGVVLANAPPELPPALHRMIANADLAAERLAAMVGDLLELARARAGRVQPRLARTDLRALARRVAGQIEPLARDRGQSLEVELPRRPIWIDVDAARLERALVNLLGNAQKHGRLGGLIRLTLAARRREVELTVADDGPGIAAADQERVFERFYRVDPGRAACPGTGLGLPIARAMVELHGGRRTLESAPGAGATFRVVLPRGRRPTTEEA
jgi:signal transduction histidine kinase